MIITARIELVCPCVTLGDRCNHPFKDRNGTEEIAVPRQPLGSISSDPGADYTIRISRCALWPDHDARRQPHRAAMPDGIGPVVKLRLEGGEWVGRCHRCGEVYTATFTPAGSMEQPRSEKSDERDTITAV